MARKDVVLSAGWDEDQSRRMGALAGGDIEYRTLPVVRYENINGEDVNIVDPAAIRAEVAGAFGTTRSTTTTTTTPNPSTVVDVVNAGATSGLAAKVSRTLTKHGYTAGTVRDREYGESTTTTVEHGTGARTDAQQIAALLGVDAAEHTDSALSPDHIQVLVGDAYSLPSQDETSTAARVAGSHHSSRTTTSSAEPTPDQGAPIDGGGVPCVN